MREKEVQRIIDDVKDTIYEKMLFSLEIDAFTDNEILEIQNELDQKWSAISVKLNYLFAHFHEVIRGRQQQHERNDGDGIANEPGPRADASGPSASKEA